MQLQQNISLKPYNTFGIDMPAEYFAEVTDETFLPLITENDLPSEKHVLGGGSNILLTKPVKGLTIHNKIKGIFKINEDEHHVWIKVGSGEIWHEFVMYAIANGWAGVENLALIPGTVGAAPIQNIGAYGVEVKEVIDNISAWHWEAGQFFPYNSNECAFGYRDSIFKHQLKNKVFITSVTFKLNKKPKFNTSYGAIEQELAKMKVTELSIKAIADVVIAIRTSKLPDPKKIGNAGSFFKNPTIAKQQYEHLKDFHPQIPSYPVDNDTVKVPAGWLIEQCGWKGFRAGETGVHDKQALVLVNYGHADGNAVWNLSENIVKTVKDKFGITLEREVQVW
ncbi:MAG: UDP-N-acetylenolpyruvoylglucosamine reductase [Bacteroidetes bacterium 43-93]|nr:UDP-N-acetylmuramate dehydrogenase [Bacteroidota bacterium]OJW96235.1 MAG: UDP-N-acetylenolpyruvoylglucosamine reductase [Bacteroidetes bacterium 43-93]